MQLQHHARYARVCGRAWKAMEGDGRPWKLLSPSSPRNHQSVTAATESRPSRSLGASCCAAACHVIARMPRHHRIEASGRAATEQRQQQSSGSGRAAAAAARGRFDPAWPAPHSHRRQRRRRGGRRGQLRRRRRARRRGRRPSPLVYPLEAPGYGAVAPVAQGEALERAVCCQGRPPRGGGTRRRHEAAARGGDTRRRHEAATRWYGTALECHGWLPEKRVAASRLELLQTAAFEASCAGSRVGRQQCWQAAGLDYMQTLTSTRRSEAARPRDESGRNNRTSARPRRR